MPLSKKPCSVCEGTGSIRLSISTMPCHACRAQGFIYVWGSEPPKRIAPVPTPLLLERCAAVLDELIRDPWKEGTTGYKLIRAEAEVLIQEIIKHREKASAAPRRPGYG